MSTQKLLQHEDLRHMPTRVVYLSAAAAVEDSGIRAGRKGGFAGASLPSSSEPTVHQEGKVQVQHLHFVSLQ